jgi:F-type H+-transporting ATPase subunit a
MQTESTNSISPETTVSTQDTPVVHETTIFAEPIGQIGGFTITNSLLSAWIALLILIVLAFTLGSKIRRIPGMMQNFAEVIVLGAMNLADSVTNDRTITEKVFPLFFSVFLFIIINNWLGLLPGVGSIGFVLAEEGHQVFIPYLRGATADINTTLAMGVFSVLAANVFGVMIVGGWKYFNKFINIQTLLSIPKDMKHNVAAVIVNPIKFFVGLIEIIGEFAKVASLSFRLFGNIFAGEVLLMAMASSYLEKPLPKRRAVAGQVSLTGEIRTPGALEERRRALAQWKIPNALWGGVKDDQAAGIGEKFISFIGKDLPLDG